MPKENGQSAGGENPPRKMEGFLTQIVYPEETAGDITFTLDCGISGRIPNNIAGVICFSGVRVGDHLKFSPRVHVVDDEWIQSPGLQIVDVTRTVDKERINLRKFLLSDQQISFPPYS